MYRHHVRRTLTHSCVRESVVVSTRARLRGGRSRRGTVVLCQIVLGLSDEASVRICRPCCHS